MAATSSSALAAVATLVSVAFACCTLERWLVRRRPHEAAWTVSLFLFAAGSTALWLAIVSGWDALSFRAFYLFGGVLNVPFLALGTVYLLANRRFADRVAVVVTALSLFAAGVVVSSPIRGVIDPVEFPTGKAHFGFLPRFFAAFGSGLASMVIIGGALWSAWRLLRGRGRPGAPTQVPAGRLAAANVLIALGTLTISGKSLFESLGDEATAFSAALASGIVLLFLGFLLTGTRRPPTAATPTPAHVAELEAAGRPADPAGDRADDLPADDDRIEATASAREPTAAGSTP
jgi:hypothetical protein